MKEGPKTVLWISRHTMTPDQLAELERGLGGPAELIPWRETVEDPAQLLPSIRRADAVAAVLPLEVMARLLPLVGERPLLVARSGRIPTGRILTLPDGRQEAEFAFVHRGWQRLLRAEVVFVPL